MANHFPPLLPGEVDLLLWINGYHSPFLDAFMYLISNPYAWVLMIGALLYYLFYQKPWQEVCLLIVCILTAILICHGLSSWVAKPFFARLRPTHDEVLADQIRVVFGYRGHLYGFFSGHTVNFVASVIILCSAVRDRALTLLSTLVVCLVIYSRMYLGVHFLSDILVGLVVGIVIGTLLAWGYQRMRPYVSPLGFKSSKEVYSKGIGILTWGIVVFVVVLVSYSTQFAGILEMIGYPEAVIPAR